MPKPRLLVLTSTFPPTVDSNEPRFVLDLCARLAGEYDIVVLTQHRPGTALEDFIHGFSVRRYRYATESLEVLSEQGGLSDSLKKTSWAVFLLPFFILSQIFHIRQALKRFKPDLVHAHWIIPQSFCAAIARLFVSNPPPIVTTSHGGDLYSFRGGLLTMLKKWTLRKSKTLTVVSSSMKRYVVEQGLFDSNNVSVMPMGVSLSGVFSTNDNVKRQPGRLVFAGRLVEKKGLTYLLDAIPALRENNKNLHLQIAGDGPESEFLRQQAKTLGIEDRVEFLGSVSHGELASLFHAAEMAIFPFVEARSGDVEGFGLVVIEAIGCGCPVIAGDVEAMHDIVSHDDIGLLCQPRKQGSITSAVLQLHNDNALRQRLSTNALEHVQRQFDWDVSAKRYVDLFHSMKTDSETD